MFEKDIYIERRKKLMDLVREGVIFFPGNIESSRNFPSNHYQFRQDSSFLYFFGLDEPGLSVIIDVDNDTEYLFGDDVEIDEIVWSGKPKSISEKSALCGVIEHRESADLPKMLAKIKSSGKQIHFLPPYREEIASTIGSLLNINPVKVISQASEILIKAIIKLRSVKEQVEVIEIEKAVDIAFDMHTAVMKIAKPGIIEKELAGLIEGLSISKGNGVSFPPIVSVRGEILHNAFQGNLLKANQLLLTDAGAESPLHYASDITRTIPVGGTFNPVQKGIYEIVLKANLEAIAAIKPGIAFKDVHLLAAKIIVEGLIHEGIMKGNADDAVHEGTHALFFPHGLGHMMGLDVHDMENLGEDQVGYTETLKRSDQFGLAYLRLARNLEPGFVITIEPGVYFIPALIDQWYRLGKHKPFINYDKLAAYKDFGGIRIEDDVLVTRNGYRVLGKPIPKFVSEIEATMNDGK